MRVFAAASIGRFGGIGELLQELSEKSGCRVVKTPELHLTFRFFGELEGTRLEKVQFQFRNLTGEKFELNIRGLGAFPVENSAKVVFLKVLNNTKIMELRDSIAKITPLDRDDREFIPHITVARFKKGSDCSGICKEYENIEFDKEITKVSLYKSELKDRGPVYSEIESVQL